MPTRLMNERLYAFPRMGERFKPQAGENQMSILLATGSLAVTWDSFFEC